MIAVLFAALALTSLLPATGQATELRLGLRVAQDWDSNATNSSSNSDSAFSVRVSPDAILEDRQGDLRWQLRYRPTFEVYYTESNLNGLDHLATLDADLQLSPQTTLSLSESFQSTQSTSSFNEQAVTADQPQSTDLVFDRRRVNRNFVSLDLAHRLSLAQSLRFSISHGIRKDDSDNTTTAQTFRAISRYNVSTTEKTTLGLGFSFTRQHFDGDNQRQDSDTDFYNVFGSWEYLVSPTFNVSLSAGPTLVDGGDSVDPITSVGNVQRFPLTNNQFVVALSCPTSDGDRVLDLNLSNSQCTGGPDTLSAIDALSVSAERIPSLPFLNSGSVSNTRLTFFANAALTKRWEQWTGTLSYRRSASESGLTSEILDTVSTGLRWDPTPRLRLRVTGAFTRRTQATDNQGSAQVVRPTTMPLSVPSLLPMGADIDVPIGSAESVRFQTVTLDNDLEIFQYFAELNARYRLRERLNVFGRFYYSKQSPQGDVQLSDGFDVYRVGVGFNYEFDPFFF